MTLVEVLLCVVCVLVIAGFAIVAEAMRDEPPSGDCPPCHGNCNQGRNCPDQR